MQYKFIEVNEPVTATAKRFLDGNLKPGLYKSLNSYITLKASKTKCELLYIGKPKAFPKNALREYVLCEVGERYQSDIANAIRVVKELKKALDSNQQPPEEVVRVRNNRARLKFSDKSVHSQIRKVRKLAEIDGYENTVIDYVDTSEGSEGLLLRLSAKGNAKYRLPYRTQKEDGLWNPESIKVVADAEKESLEIARERARDVKKTFILKNKAPQKRIYNNPDIKTIRELHEYNVSRESLKQSTIDEYNKTAYNYLGSEEDRNELRKRRNEESNLRQAVDNGQDTYIGLNILDQDFDSFRFHDLKEMHQTLSAKIKESQKKVKKKATGRQADKVFTYLRDLINLGNKLMIEKDHDWNVRNPIEMFTTMDVWNNKGGNSKRKNKTIPRQYYHKLYKALLKYESFRFEVDENYKQRKNTKKEVVGYKLNSLFFQFMLFMGLRPEDTTKILWEQVDLATGLITWDEEQRVNIKNYKDIESEYFLLPLNPEALKVVRKLKSFYEEYRQIEIDKLQHSIDYFKTFSSPDFDKIKELEECIKGIKEDHVSHKYLFCNSTFTNKIGQNPTLFIDMIEKEIGHRVTAGAFRAGFQQKGIESGLLDYELKRLVFHKMNVSKDTQAGYNMSDPDHLKRLSIRVMNKILGLCNAGVEMETYLYLDSDAIKNIKEVVDFQLKDAPDEEIAGMSVNDYEAYVSRREHRIEQVAQEMITDFIKLLKKKSMAETVESMNDWGGRSYKLPS